MSNLQTWNNLRTPHKDALKPITGGRLRGMTDISPQWRLMKMTEEFGPIGVGWWYSVVAVEYPLGPEGQVACMVQIELYVIRDGKPSNPISGVGGSSFVEKEKAGLHMNDEALKMATTDALGVAMKQLGMAADVYLNNMDGSKYKTVEQEAKDTELITKEQDKILQSKIESTKTDVDSFLAFYKVKETTQLTVSQYQDALKKLAKKAQK